ncbi:hypothetical protein APHAL10511_003221 [Amanita phalloides]|nr:hypothetical protein APHAL10511_003221 [Amanita phalloides]
MASSFSSFSAAVPKLATTLLGIWLTSIILRKWGSVRKALRDLGDVPGREVIWIHPFYVIALVMAAWYPRPGSVGYYYAKFSLFKKYGTTCLSSVHFWTSTPIYFISDADAFRFISNERAVFEKETEPYEAVDVYGKNIVSTVRGEWKRHRAVSKNAFNEANNAYVWSETCRTINQWFSTFESKSEHHLDCLNIFKQITFLIIASAGFGANMDFNDSLVLTSGPVIDKDYTADSTTKPKYTFGSSLMTIVNMFRLVALTPDFVYPIAKAIRIPYLSRALEEVAVSRWSLKLHMQGVISHARDTLFAQAAKGVVDHQADVPRYKDVGSALLRTLVKSNMNEEAGKRNVLTDDEIISDTFFFLLAGHETTSHTLCFALSLLALHPEVQAKAYEEVSRLWPDAPPVLDVSPAYKSSMQNLEYIIAIFHETLRLFSSVPRLGKKVLSDTIIKTHRFTTNGDGTVDNVEVVSTPIKAGSMVILDVHALHYNPIHWGNDVSKFKPERFIDTETYKWPRDAFAGFAQGQRSCIGQRFAITEATCILANLIRRYEVLLPTDLESKPRTEQEKDLFQWIPMMTITPQNTRMRLRKRVEVG